MIALLFALLTAAPQAAQGAQDPAAAVAQPQGQLVEETQMDRDTRQLAAELRCPVCQGLSLEDSPSELSQEMRQIIRDQLEAGKTVPEVKAYFVEKYGEWILLQPEPHGFNLAVYILPVLLLAGGALFVYSTAKKWTRQGAIASQAAAEGAEDRDEVVTR